MRHRSLTVFVFALIFLQATDCRSHRRRHYQDEDNQLQDEDHHRDENHHQNEDHYRGKDHHRDNVVRHHEEILALEHSELVSESGICNLPRPQVVQVSDHYPGRYFLPHCTILHRCGRHSGCCGTDRLRCVAVHQEKVFLNFYSVRIGEGSMERKVEKLVFTNHTKCGCSPDHRVLTRNDL